MPFLAECLFCNHQVQVPDHALGASGRCPKCRSSFTLVPTTNAPRAASHPAAPSLPGGPASPAPPCLDPSAGNRAGAIAVGVLPRLESLAALDVPAVKQGPRQPRRRIDPLGLIAVLLGAAALLAASQPPFTGLVVPASIVGLLTGLAAVLLARASGRSPLLFPVAGAAVSGGVLFTALFLPSLLGPAYQASRQRDVVDPLALRVVPLPGQGKAEELGGPDWVDASRASLQQGRVRLQVVQVVVGPVEVQAPPPNGVVTEEALLLRLRVHQVEDPRAFAADPLAPARVPVYTPTLTDDTGKVYAARALPPEEPAEDDRSSAVFPVSIVENVFAFEPAPPGVALRLEVPAAAWGGRGAFRFAIPAAMIHREPAAPARDGRLGR